MPFDSEITTKSRELIVLEKARERIAQGWCQGNFNSRGPGPACIVGALIGVSETTQEHTSAYRALGFTGGGEVVGWNDAPGRTQVEVLARFDAAIERLSA